MATFGITLNGFVLKRLDDILTEASADLSSISDPVSGEFLQPDFDSSDPTMQVVKIPLEGYANAWELSQATYNVTNRVNAVGPSLDNVNDISGTSRKLAIPSTVTLGCTGTPLATVPTSQQVSDQFNTQAWLTNEEFTFDGSGDATVTATAILSNPLIGAIEAVSGTITRIITPVATWATCTNPLDAVVGQNQETDTAFRQRGDISTAAPSQGVNDSIYTALLALDNVTYVRVYDNRELIVDPNGIPAKSVAAIVQGGDDSLIGQVLFERTGLGSLWFGNTTAQVTDKQGFIYNIDFFRPVEKEIYVEVTLTITDMSIFPADGVELIKGAIVEYALGGAAALGIPDGFNDNFQPSENIVRSRLYTPINSVAGASILSLKIGLTALGVAEVDIPIAFNELGVFDTSRIVVSTV